MSTTIIKSIMVLVSVVVLHTTTVNAADNIYVTVTGAIQGPFRGEVFTAGLENKTFRGLKFDYEVISPRASQTGLPSGKRTHKPLLIQKAWGPSSVQIFSALTHNELLTVVIDFFSLQRTGKLGLDHTIKLNNASVMSFHSNADTDNRQAPPTDTMQLVFQSIELIDHVSQSAAMDSLTGTAGGK